MSYKIQFWTFSKRTNSTLRPTTSGAEMTCQLMTQESILRPVFTVQDATPFIYNYAYIPDFSRYYWIIDCQWDNGLWVLSMSVDVLASWKTNIGNINTFINRAEYDTSKRFPDDIYKIASESTIKNDIHAGVFSGDIDKGCFVLGIVGSGGQSTIGAVNYYVCSKTVLKIIINRLFNDTSWLNITDISADLQKALFNPIQYIKSCMFYPFAMSNISSKTVTTSIQFGWWTMTAISVQELYILENNPHVELGFTMTIPKHPLAASRGSYMNLSPNTIYNLMYLPYGSWMLDTTILINYNTLVLAQTIDLINGQGILYISCYNDTTQANDQFDVRLAQIGVPIAVAQMTTDWFGSVISSGVNFVSAIASGNFGDMINGSFNTLASMVPKAQISGTNGGFDTYNLNIILQSQFMTPAPENATIFGNPCYTNGQISSYPGYIEAEPGNNAIPCFESELQEINNFFVNGFYYE